MKTKILVVVGILIILIGYNLYSPHYSDRKMTQHFLDKEEDFNKLAKMFSEDTQIHFITDSNSPHNVFPTDTSAYPLLTREQLLSDERYEEYLRLLRKLNFGNMISRNDDTGLIKLSYTVSRLERNVDGGDDYTEKGFVYSPQSIWNLRESLDWGETGYKRINDNWYLYCEKGVLTPE